MYDYVETIQKTKMFVFMRSPAYNLYWGDLARPQLSKHVDYFYGFFLLFNIFEYVVFGDCVIKHVDCLIVQRFLIILVLV